MPPTNDHRGAHETDDPPVDLRIPATILVIVAIICIAAICPSPSSWKPSKEGSDLITAYATAAAAFFAFIATLQTWRTAARSENAARAQRLADLFEDIQKLRYLTDAELDRIEQAATLTQKQMTPLDETIGLKISSNANILEKLAFCWRNNLVNRPAIEEQLREDYVLAYDQIKEQPTIMWLNQTGEDIVKQMPSATRFRNYLAATNQR